MDRPSGWFARTIGQGWPCVNSGGIARAADHAGRAAARRGMVYFRFVTLVSDTGWMP